MTTANASKANLGQRLRELRTQHQWRIADVSQMTGLAASTISKVENGRMSLTDDKLQQLAQGLSLDLADLLGDSRTTSSAASPSAAARRSVGRSGDGAYVTAGWYEYWYLNADLVPKQMVPMKGRVTARSLDEFGDLIRHEGEEFLLVLEGTIVVHTEFYAPLVLHVGDHIYIDSRMGHAYLAGEEGECRILVVCSQVSTEDLQRVAREKVNGNASSAQTSPSQEPLQGTLAKTSGEAKRRTVKPRR
jgi:transcriptional regulator with XRE-family HTH domain